MEQDVDRICCQNELAAAERYMNAGDEHPEGGNCSDCSHCVDNCFDEADSSMRDTLNAEYGICKESTDYPFLVRLDEWHDWNDCWCPYVEAPMERKW